MENTYTLLMVTLSSMPEAVTPKAHGRLSPCHGMELVNVCELFAKKKKNQIKTKLFLFNNDSSINRIVG